MAYTFKNNYSPATGTQAIYDLKTLLKSVGWIVTSSGDGTSASSFGTTLSGTFGVTNGSTTVSTTGNSQVGIISTGTYITFGSQTSAIYQVTGTVSSGSFSLSTAYTGTTASATTASVGDCIESANSGANGLANTQAWFTVRDPAGLRSFQFYRGTTDILWSIQYSPLAGFVSRLLFKNNAGSTPPYQAYPDSFAVTNGSASVTPTTSQNFTISSGTLITFASQPGTTYTVSSALSSSPFTITLTAVYTGSTASATLAYVTVGHNALSGTFGVSNGSTTVSTTANYDTGTYDQVLAPGMGMTFASQPGVSYTVVGIVSTTSMTISPAYTGTTNGATTAYYGPGNGGTPIMYAYPLFAADVQPVFYTFGSCTTLFAVSATAPIRWNVGASNVAPYPFWAGAFPVGGGTASTAIVFDALTSGTYVSQSLSGMFNVQNGSPSVTTSVSQVNAISAGAIISFASQTNVTYTVTTPINSTTITLTGNYTGTTNTTTTGFVGDPDPIVTYASFTTPFLHGTVNGMSGEGTSTTSQTSPFGYTNGSFVIQPACYLVSGSGSLVFPSLLDANPYSGYDDTFPIIYARRPTVSALSGTFNVTNGSTNVPTSANPVTSLVVGNVITFASQPGVSYLISAVANATAGPITLSTAYTGTTTSGTSATANTGIKGISSVMRWNGVSRSCGDTLTLVTTNDRIVYGDVNLPWDGSAPVV